MSFSIKKYYHPVILFLAIACAGCSLFENKELLNKKKEELELKKKNFAALSEKLSTQSLKKGTTTQEIRDTYGEPDDIFQSQSSVSSFAIWTYEQVLDEKEEGMGFQPIRLYFNNNKLSSWKN